MSFPTQKQKVRAGISARVAAALAFAVLIGFAAFAAHSIAAPRASNAADSHAAPPTVNFKTLYTFTGGSDGAYPVAALIRDAQGNLYGTASNGGDSTCGFIHENGCGVIFELTPSGQEIVLYTFTGPDGNFPVSSLVMDSQGNLYGTTYHGGTSTACGSGGCGVVFKLAPPATKGQPWTETVLHSFNGGLDDGQDPMAGLTLDGKGNAYGTTFSGGVYGTGILFKLNNSGAETILYSFCKDTNTFGNCDDGALPMAAPILGSGGYLYGTTVQGGDPGDGNEYASGSVYSFSPSNKESVLYSFQGAPDGGSPESGLVQDAQGNFYGTTVGGGTGVCARFSCGTAYQVSPQGHEVILHSFQGSADGGNPVAGLFRLPNGALFGTTAIGGSGTCASANGGTGCGTIFEISPNGKEQVIYSFTGSSGGAFPQAALITDGKGHAYGTSAGTYLGYQSGFGTVFEISQ